MAISLTRKTVAGTFVQADGVTPAKGGVSVKLTAPLLDSAGNVIVEPSEQYKPMDATGSVQFSLVATNDPSVNPDGVAYRFVVRINGEKQARTFDVEIDHAAPDTINLADLVPASVTPVYTYALQSALIQGLADAATDAQAKADAAETAAIAAAATDAQGRVDTHAALTQDAHGIPDTGKLVSLSPNGLLSWDTAKTQTTVGPAGGADALPAQPARWLKVEYNGLTYVVPAYYASEPLTITAPVQYEVIQRNPATGLGDIAISGTYSGLPTAIEARWNGGAWTTVDAAPTGGTFAGTLANQPAGQGTLEVRFTNDTAITGSVPLVGIGDIFIIAGQSNASGRGVSNQVYSHATLKAALFRNDYTWKELTDPVDSATGQVDVVSDDQVQLAVSPGGSYWPLLATKIMADQGVPVAFVPTALGSTGISVWQPGANHQDRATLYGSMVYRGLQTGARAVLWHQGEGDANAGTTQVVYNSALDTLANSIQADLAIPLVPTKLQNSIGFSDSGEATINAAIAEAWGDNPNVWMGPDLSSLSTDDTAHFTQTASLQKVADRWWSALKASVYQSVALPTTGLLAEYRFYEGAGTTLKDYSGGGRHGTFGGGAAAPIWIPGGLDFQSSDHVLLPAILNPGATDWTIIAVVKTDVVGGEAQSIFAVQDGVGTGRAVMMVASDAQGINNEFGSFLSGVVSRSGFRPTAGVYYGVAMTYDNMSHAFQWYVNGVAYNGNTVTVESATGSWVMGMDKAIANTPLNGSGHYGVFYNQKLSAGSITSAHAYLKEVMASRGITLA